MFVFNVPPTAIGIRRWCHDLVSSDGLEEMRVKLGTPGYKASGDRRLTLTSLKMMSDVKF